ncbi:MAG: hypothetical protein ABIP51_12370 [Bacteroidia bacterium]
MYEKKSLTKFIEKYYLNGLVGSAQLEASNNNLETVFRNIEGNLRGVIKLDNIKLPDGFIGVYYTTKLLSMLSILNDDIDIVYKGENADKSIVSLELSDTKGRKAIYGASSLEIIDFDGKKGLVKNYEVSIDLNSETIQDILKCFSALSSKTFTILKRDNKLFAIFNYTGTNLDQIELELDGKVDNDFDNDDYIIFPGDPIKEILSINGKAFDKATLNVSIKGMMQLKFEEKGLTAEYWLMKNS